MLKIHACKELEIQDLNHLTELVDTPGQSWIPRTVKDPFIRRLWNLWGVGWDPFRKAVPEHAQAAALRRRRRNAAIYGSWRWWRERLGKEDTELAPETWEDDAVEAMVKLERGNQLPPGQERDNEFDELGQVKGTNGMPVSGWQCLCHGCNESK